MITTRKLHHVTVLPDGQLEVKEIIIYEENGEEVVRKYHRFVATPDQDAEKLEVPRVKEIATALWTPAVKSAYLVDKAAREAKAAAEFAPVVVTK